MGDAGLRVERIRDSPGFVRFQVSSEDEVCEVDLAYDAPLREPQATYAGPVLADEELAADKMLALFGRAAGRDFADVYALLDRITPRELMEVAAAKDAGFTPQRFVEAIEAIGRLPRQDFPVDDATLVALRLDAWRRALRRDLDPPQLGRSIDGPDFGPSL